MIYWGFLILAFCGGIAVCYGIIYQAAKLCGKVLAAIEGIR